MTMTARLITLCITTCGVVLVLLNVLFSYGFRNDDLPAYRFIENLIYADLISFVLISVFIVWFVRRTMRPVRQLIDGIRSVEWSQLPRLSMENQPREVQSLADSVNKLLEQAEKGVRDQSRFIADASHELRTPLAIIAGHANLLRRWGNTAEQVWEPAVRHIVSEVDRLQSMVDHLLLLSRLESGFLVTPEPLSSEQIRNTMVQLREDGLVLRPDLDWRLATHIPARVEAHIARDDLRQVLVTIIDNAMRHTSTGSIELMVNVDEPWIRFTIRDTGEGIPEDALHRVFDRFYRVEESRSRKLGGSGLGLSICREIVEAYGGRIILHSTLMRGTTVTILLPQYADENDSLYEDTAHRKGAEGNASTD